MLAQESGTPVPKADLQMLSEIVTLMKEQYTEVVNDAALAAGCVAGMREAGGGAARSPDPASLRAIPALLVEVRKSAAPGTSYRTLANGCARGMAGRLDVGSRFLDSEEFRELQVGSGGVAAVGLELRKFGDAVVVVSVIDGTPAQRGSIEPGDAITRIDGAPTTGMALASAIRGLRGTAGSTVKLTLQRAGRSAPIEVELRREVIRVPSARLEWLSGDVLGIRIAQFGEATRSQLVRDLGPMIGQREPSGLLLDLRDNTGGLLYSAIEVTALFLDADAVVGSTAGRARDVARTYRASEPPRSRWRYDDPPIAPALAKILAGKTMTVLVNGRTASGAEIAAAALQQNRRASLIGTPTFGAGAIQTIFPLAGSGALRLTTSHWLGPSGRRLEGNPLQPDLIVAAEVDSNAQKRVDLQRQTALEVLAAKAARAVQ